MTCSTGTSDIHLGTAADKKMEQKTNFKLPTMARIQSDKIMQEIHKLKKPVTFHDFQRLVYSVVKSSLGSNQYVTTNTYQCAMAERFGAPKSDQSLYSSALHDPRVR